MLSSAPKRLANGKFLFLKTLTLALVLLLMTCLGLVGCNTLSEQQISEAASTKALNEYLDAIKANDIEKQKKLTAEKAQRFTLFKELEDKVSRKVKEKVELATPDFKVEFASAELVRFAGGTTITTIRIKDASISPSMHTFEDPQFKKIDDQWKLVDYVRDSKPISESVYIINQSAKTPSFKIRLLDLLLLPKRTLIEVVVQNISSDDIITEVEKSRLTVVDTRGNIEASFDVQREDRVLKHYYYVRKDRKITAFMGFGPITNKDGILVFDLQLAPQEKVQFRLSF